MTDDARHPLSRRQILKTATGAAAALSLGRPGSAQGTAPPPAQGATMMGAPFEKRAVVRVGLIGCGSRGPGHVGDLLGIEGVEIKAVCDARPERAASVQDRVEKAGRPRPEGLSSTNEDRQRGDTERDGAHDHGSSRR